VWQLEEGPQGSTDFFILHLARKDKTKEWRVQIDAKKYPTCLEGCQIYFLPTFWLPKEPYVFLSGQACCGEASYFYDNGFKLARLNLNTGTLTDLIPSNDPTSPHYFSFSPTGQFLLYTQPQVDNALHFYRLTNGEVETIRLPATQAESGQASWAPDESKLGLVICRVPDGSPGPYACQSAFWVLDLNTRQARLLVTDLEGLKTGAEDGVQSFFWLSLARISIHMRSGAAWVVNLVSGELTCRGADNMPCQPYVQLTATSESP
jgi:hypothetical protein